MESLNRMAVELVDEAIEFAPELGLAVHERDSGATVLDFGVEVPGGLETGLLLAEVTTAGLATVGTTVDETGGAPRTHVEVTTDHPATALLCAAKAGWELSLPGFEGLGSGPARALVAEEAEFEAVGYRDEFDLAVLAVESDRLPDQSVAEHVAERAGVPRSAVYLPAFSTGSITGSVVSAARAAELAVFRLFELGYDPLDVLSVTGSAPVAPPSDDESTALARTGDALAYGSRVHLQVAEPFDRFDEVPSTAADEHGTPLAEAFDAVDWRFEALSPALFGPAQVTVDVRGEGAETHGARDHDLLAESFAG
jgi:methenyltetrahydromethanopterin cyclohydrolase